MSSSTSSSSSDGGAAGLKKSKKEGVGMVFLTIRVCFVSALGLDDVINGLVFVDAYSCCAASCSRL